MVEDDSKAKWKGSWMVKAADGIWSGCGSSYGWIRWWGTLPWCEEAKYEIEMGLCHDLMRQTMLLSWDFALMRWSEVWCESWLNPSRDHSKHVDNLKSSSSWLIMDCSRGSLSLYEDSRQEGWLGGLDLVVVEGSSMLKSKSTWGAHNDYR